LWENQVGILHKEIAKIKAGIGYFAESCSPAFLDEQLKI
jgi:hypothetical protein